MLNKIKYKRECGIVYHLQSEKRKSKYYNMFIYTHSDFRNYKELVMWLPLAKRSEYLEKGKDASWEHCRSLHFLWDGLNLCTHAQLLCYVWLFAMLWTVARQGPLSMGFPRQEYWTGLPFPPPGDLLNPGIKHESPAIQADSLLLSPFKMHICYLINKHHGFPGVSEGKESACKLGDPGPIPGSGRSLEKGMATHSSVLARRFPWTEEPGGLQSIWLQKVRDN